MKILAIETSCDETGIAVLDHSGGATVELCGNALASQIDIHAQYGGVFPALAKRAHTEKIIPLLIEALTQASLLKAQKSTVGTDAKERIVALCTKDTLLADYLETFLNEYTKPSLAYIAVTVGPGLEPALWVGVNTARVLSAIWDIPLIPINHMEGHVVTAMFDEIAQQDNFSGPRAAELGQAQKNYLPASSQKIYQLIDIPFPTLSLLVSGGHTELVITDTFGTYRKIGKTRDDAVGEAFDKVARQLGLPYPGGPAISKLAAEFRASGGKQQFPLPRPMIHSGDYDFSFSGIKTAVLYAIRDHGNMSNEDKQALACEFENAVVEVLIKKTLDAIDEHRVQTVIVGGGVAGNRYLRLELTSAIEATYPQVSLLFPEPWLATDNAVMIGMAAITHIKAGQPLLREGFAGQVKTSAPDELKADGNLSL